MKLSAEALKRIAAKKAVAERQLRQDLAQLGPKVDYRDVEGLFAKYVTRSFRAEAEEWSKVSSSDVELMEELEKLMDRCVDEVLPPKPRKAVDRMAALGVTLSARHRPPRHHQKRGSNAS